MAKSRKRRIQDIPRGGFGLGKGGVGKARGRMGNMAGHMKKGSSFIRIFDEYNQIADGLDKGADFLETADQLHNDYVRPLKLGFDSKVRTKIGIVTSPSEHTNGGENMVPAFVENSKVKTSLANASDDRHVYKTVFHSGKKPSAAVLAAKKQNGSGYRVLADSMIEATTAEERNALTYRTGFNNKIYVAPPTKSQVPEYLVKDLIAWDQSDINEPRSPRIVLSNVMNIKQQFMIKNTAANFPMKFTIHLVKIRDQSYAANSLNSLMGTTFYGSGQDLDDYGVLRKGYIPKYLQHDTLAFEATGKMVAARVLTSNKLRSLSKSSNFRTCAEIVESFSKVIPPGDFWNFSHIHHCGSGIDLMSLYRKTNEGGGEEDDVGLGITADLGNFPLTYGVIFEAQGKTAEAYSIPAENIVNTYLGTSPVSFAFEFKTSAYFAADELDSTNVSTPSTRIYEQDYALQDFGTISDAREKFFLPTDLVQNTLAPTLANVGKAYVPMMTSVVSSPALFEGNQDPG